jgi:hypothetical protein
MKTLLMELERNVEAEIAVQTGIQGLLDEQLEILLHGGTKNLTALLARAEDGLDRSRSLEQERLGLLARIGAKLGISAKEVSLKIIEERIGADAASLTGKGAELKALIERIRDRNREVGLLLRHSVLFIEDLVRAVTGQTAAAPTYTREGAMAPPDVGSLAAEA